jgi:hypothetical protein
MGAIILLLDVFLLPRMGIRGAGISQLISSIAGSVLTVALNWELFRRTFRILWLGQTGLALLTVLVMARLWPVHSPSVVEALAHIFVGAATFATASLLTGYLRFDELAALYGAFARRPRPPLAAFGAQRQA